MGRLAHAVCIFDLDGTLVDSAPDLAAALNRLLAEEGLPPMPLEEVRPLVGDGARAMLKAGFERQGRAFPDGEAQSELIARYVEDYAGRISEHSSLFPGVADCLAELAASGASLAVCTNKRTRLAELLLKNMGIFETFDLVVAADTLAERKPSPLPLRHIVETTARPRGIMIGDTATDVLAAKAAAMPVIVMRSGYGFHDARVAEAIEAEGFADIPALINDHLR